MATGSTVKGERHIALVIAGQGSTTIKNIFGYLVCTQNSPKNHPMERFNPLSELVQPLHRSHLQTPRRQSRLHQLRHADTVTGASATAARQQTLFPARKAPREHH